MKISFKKISLAFLFASSSLIQTAYGMDNENFEQNKNPPKVLTGDVKPLSQNSLEKVFAGVREGKRGEDVANLIFDCIEEDKKQRNKDIEKDNKPQPHNEGYFQIFNTGGKKVLFGSIIEFLPIKDILSLSQCSKGMFALCNADYSWKIIARNNGIVLFEENIPVKDFVKNSILSKKLILGAEEGLSEFDNWARAYNFSINKQNVLKARDGDKIFRKDGKAYKVHLEIYGTYGNMFLMGGNETIFMNGHSWSPNQWSTILEGCHLDEDPNSPTYLQLIGPDGNVNVSVAQVDDK